MKHSGHQNKQLVSTESNCELHVNTLLFSLSSAHEMPIILAKSHYLFYPYFFQFIITSRKKGTSVMTWSCSKSNLFLTVILFHRKIVIIKPECFFFSLSIQHFLFHTPQLAIKKALQCRSTII